MDDEVLVRVNTAHIEAENIGEFYPQAVQAVARVIEALEDGSTLSRAHRDAGLLAACAVAAALQEMVASEGTRTLVEGSSGVS